MKKILLLLTAALVLAGCSSGVSRADLDRISMEQEELRDQVATLNKKLNKIVGENDLKSDDGSPGHRPDGGMIAPEGLPDEAVYPAPDDGADEPSPELIFRGMPFSEVVRYSFDELDGMLGGYDFESGDGFHYDDIIIAFWDGRIDHYWLDPKDVTVGGTSAELNLDGLTDLFGTPYEEDFDVFYGYDVYYASYFLLRYEACFIFNMEEPERDTVWHIFVYPN